MAAAVVSVICLVVVAVVGLMASPQILNYLRKRDHDRRMKRPR